MTVREFAAGLLVEAGEAGDALARHLHHFSSMSEPTQGWPSRVAERVVPAWTGEVPLEPVDSVSVLTVCDSSIDLLLPGQGPARRLPLARAC